MSATLNTPGSKEPTKSQLIPIRHRILDASIVTLNGLAEVAAFLNCSISTVRVLIQHHNLPVASTGDRGRYRTTKLLLIQWMKIEAETLMSTSPET